MSYYASGVKKPSVTRAVLDASALLALLFKEPGAKLVVPHLPGSMLSAINLSEVVSKAVENGLMLEDARRMLSEFPCQIVPFDVDAAYLTASLRAATRPFGLSLGDRACLALALSENVPAVTADQSWAKCDLGVKVIQIR